MTRIIAGLAKGRRLEVPATGTRPTTDRAREALFSMVEAAVDLPGAHIVDVFAGSGALALEALSRGAHSAVCIEASGAVTEVIRRNARAVGITGLEVITGRAEDVLARPAAQPADIMLLDPPYAVSAEEVAALVRTAVGQGWLREDSLIVLERPSDAPETPLGEGFTHRKSKSYGRARVESFYVDAV